MEEFEQELIGFSEPQPRPRNPVSQIKINHFGSIAAVVISAYVSYRASKAQQDAADDAAQLAQDTTDAALEAQGKGLDWQKEMYADFRPYLQKGLKGYEELLKDPSKYKKTPGYMFRLKEGLKSVGIPDGGSKYLSGSQIKAAMKYGQNYATGEYDRALQRQGMMAGLAGQAAGVGLRTGIPDIYGNMSGTMMQGAGLQGQYMQNAGTARASGYLGVGSAISQGTQNYQYQKNYDAWLKQQNQQQTTTGDKR